jgi:ABC-2 type transport system ATP-binding protein
VLTLTCADPAAVKEIIAKKFGVVAEQLDGTVRLERQRGHEFVPQLIEALPGLIDSVSVGKPTLEDVFIQLTGHGLASDAPTTKRGRNAH